MAAGRELELAPVGAVAWMLLGVIGAIGPVAIGIVYLSSPEAREQSLALTVAALVCLAVVVPMLLAARRRSVTLDGPVLDVRATFYKRRIPLAEIDLQHARAIDLREHPEARPWLKTNGFAVPGLAAGNFRDRQKNQLFCLVTAPKILMLPLENGRRLLISFERPAAALERLRREQGGG